MKKIFGLIVVILLVFAGWKGWDYYQTTYVGQDYYAIIEAPLPEEMDINDANGKVMGRGFQYDVTGYSEKGDTKPLMVEVITTGDYRNGDAYAEGTLFKIKASEKRIIEKKVISLDDIPTSLQNNFK